MRPTKGLTAAQSNEQQRRWTDRAWQHAANVGNYDRSREHLNFEIARGGAVVPVDKTQTIPERIAAILNSRGIKDPNEGMEEPYYRTVVNIIYSGNRERMLELAFGDQAVDTARGVGNAGITRREGIEQWAQDMYRFTRERWGEENIASFICHLDEVGPHIHCTLLPIDRDNKFAFKRIFAGKDKYEFKARMKALHTAVAEVNARWGLERGDDIEVTGARHTSVAEYRKQLSRECRTLEESIEQNKARLALLQHDIAMAERRVKGLQKMVENLTAKKSGIENEMSRLDSELAAGRGDAAEIRSRIMRLDLELQAVIDKLADKQAKLDTAVQQRQAIIDQIDELKARRQAIQGQVYEAARQMEQHIRIRLKEAMAESVASDFRSLLPQMTGRELDVFDGTLLADMATRGEQILECALLLFGGLMDKATDFAQGHGGGGGGGSSMPWGRKDDEDDRAWAMRCLRTAHKMMKPSGGKHVRR